MILSDEDGTNKTDKCIKILNPMFHLSHRVVSKAIISTHKITSFILLIKSDFNLRFEDVKLDFCYRLFVVLGRVIDIACMVHVAFLQIWNRR